MTDTETGTAQEEKGLKIQSHDRGQENWNYEAPAKKRLTFRAPEPLLEELELLVEAGVFYNRAEALRAGLRSVVFGDYDPLPKEKNDD